MSHISVFQSSAILSLLLLAQGCDFGKPLSQSPGTPPDHPPSVDPQAFLIKFAVTDTTGEATTTVRTGESFDIRFSITNETGADQLYYASGPIVSLEIWRADSLVCRNIDGLYWTADARRDTLHNAQSLDIPWRAPNPWGHGRHVVLNPGPYKAQATIRTSFGEYRPPNPEPIDFTVVD